MVVRVIKISIEGILILYTDSRWCPYTIHHPGRAPMEMKDCINNLIHSLLQQGDDIRQRSYGAAPSATKDLTTTTSGDGRATRADAKNQFIWRKS
jgi:hypothetical protein